MSTIIQTCYESQFMETSSKVLKLKVSASSSSSRDELKINNISSKTEYGTKSFLHYLTNTSSSTSKLDKDNVYVHTLSKSASSRLSEQSLQLCTENLGCETGSFLMFDSTNILSLSSSSSRTEEIKEKKTEGSYSMKKARSLSAFPPPLTTMCGEKALQIKSVRENGRLISKAVKIPSKESCFVADRSDGRLRLTLLNDFETNYIVDQVQVMSPSEKFQTSPNMSEEDEEEDDLEMTSNDEIRQNKGVDDDNNDDDDDNDDKKCKLILSKEVVNYDVEGEYNMGKDKFRRFVRCKECNKGLSKWEPMWVATS